MGSILFSTTSFANPVLFEKIVTSEGTQTIFKKIPDPTILFNSYVVEDVDDDIKISATIKKLGRYKYSIDLSNSETPSDLKAIAMKMGLTKGSQKTLALIKDISGSYKIIEKSIIVEFQSLPNLANFAEGYDLSLEQNLSDINAAVFEVKDIQDMNEILDIVRQDIRVKRASFNIIDPLIKPQ